MSEMKVSEIIYREDLYPRIKKDPVTVQRYAEDLDVLPAIEVNQHGELIDGWHRWTAHKKRNAETINVFVTETKSESQFLELAIERNATHGLQLSQEDKRNMARRIYNSTPERERDTKKKQLSKILSVADRTVREWLSKIDEDTKKARDERIFNKWLACWTQDEIAESEGLTKETISQVCQILADLPESDKLIANHLTEFEVPLYNVWKQATKTPGSSHFGNSEVRWVDNLLYLYTKPFDIVVDPFAGGGSTIDICRKRFRRYWVSDRKPTVERETEIRMHDMIKDGSVNLPDLRGRWKDVGLVYLDPPYWRQAQNKYSEDPTDLANMDLPEFNKVLSSTIKTFAKKLTTAHIALIIQPTQWNAPEKQYTDHVIDMCRMVDLPITMRIQAPYMSQQYNAQMVDWAKENKQILVLSREIIVWRVE